MSYPTRGRQLLNEDETILKLRASLIAKNEEITRLKDQVRAKQGAKNIEQRKKLTYFHDRRALIKEKKTFQAMEKAQKERLEEAAAREKELQMRIKQLEERSPELNREYTLSKSVKGHPSRLVVVEPALSQLDNNEHTNENDPTSSASLHDTLKAAHNIQKGKLEDQLKSKDKENDDLKSQLEKAESHLAAMKERHAAVEVELLQLEKENQSYETFIREVQPRQERLLKIEAKLSELMTDFNINATPRVEELE